MELLPQIGREFLGLFYPEIDDLHLDDCGTRLNLHILKIENNEFAYFDLIEFLFDGIIPYSLSRQEMEAYKNRPGGLYVKAVQKLRNYNSNDGELGEILLYCFLESHLCAPKIITKLELKTSNNDYVKGSDGIHLLKIDEQNYQLVFGESKLDNTLQKSLYEAFKSINDFIHRKDNNIHHEVGLLNSHLKKEAINDQVYDVLKKIIMPSAAEDDINRDNAFGIFVGFDLKISEDMLRMPNSEFRKKIRLDIKQLVEAEINYIKKKIKDYNLFGKAFYVYIFPFVNLSETRRRVIKNLKEAHNDF